MGVTSFGRWLTPLDEWRAEIHKLNEDELFVQRWMLVNNDPTSREKGKRAIVRIQKRRNAIEKKRNRFLWWYLPERDSHRSRSNDANSLATKRLIPFEKDTKTNFRFTITAELLWELKNSFRLGCFAFSGHSL